MQRKRISWTGCKPLSRPRSRKAAACKPRTAARSRKTAAWPLARIYDRPQSRILTWFPPRFHARFPARFPAAVLTLLLLLLPALLFARAGGAGGSSSGPSGSSGGGDADFIIYLIFWMFRILGPVPSLIIIGVIVIVAVAAKGRHDRQAGNALANIPQGDRDGGRIPGSKAFMAANPEFSEDAFFAKVRHAFLEIQDAWSRQDLSGVRRYISDGVYQRFSTQFAMMGLLGQKNIIKDVRIHRMFIESFEEDAGFSVVNVGIHASMDDLFKSPDLPALNSHGTQDFVEFWSFIRKGRKNASSGDGEQELWKDIYSSNRCPKCDAPLPDDLGERGSCPYCSALVNSGEYDWVLSEISQADDYGAEKALKRRYDISSRIAELKKYIPGFSVQGLEDHASNAFFQIMRATSSQEPEAMRRFTSDRAYESLVAAASGQQLIFSRLYTNYVSLIGSRMDEGRIVCYLALRYSSQRIQLEGRKLTIMDPAVRSDDKVMVLSRRISGGNPGYGDNGGSASPPAQAGSLLMHQCPSCSGPISDSLDLHCPYCGQLYNSGEHDWVVDGFLSLLEYQQQFSSMTRMKVRLNPALLGQLYEIGEYVLINLMVMAAADGQLRDEELQFIRESARELRIDQKRLEPLLTMARSGRLSIRMPLDMGKRRKIIDLMHSLAQADGSVSEEEKALLDRLEEAYVKALDASSLF